MALLQRFFVMVALGLEMQLRNDTEAAAETRYAIEDVQASNAKSKSSLRAESPHTEEKEHHQEHG